LVVCFFPGAFNLGSIIFLAFDLIHEQGIASLRFMMITLATILSFLGLLSFWLYPDSPYKRGDPAQIRHLSDLFKFSKRPNISTNSNYSSTENSYDSLSVRSTGIQTPDGYYSEPEDQKNANNENTEMQNTTNMTNTTTTALEEETKSQISITEITPIPYSMRLYDSGSLKTQILSPEYWGLVIFYAVTNLRLNFIVGTFRDQTEEHEHGEFLSKFNAAILPAGSIFVLLVGRLMDKYGAALTFTIITIHSLIYGTLILFSSFEFAMVTSVMLAAGRPFLAGGLSAYVAKLFGFKRFGLLGGSANFFAGVINLGFQYLLIQMTYSYFDGNFWNANLGLLIAGVVFVSISFILWRKHFMFRRVGEKT
jgi:hypothetical protein